MTVVCARCGLCWPFGESAVTCQNIAGPRCSEIINSAGAARLGSVRHSTRHLVPSVSAGRGLVVNGQQSRCGTESTTRRCRIPWCSRCGIWLVRDDIAGQWISFAEHAHRQRRYQRLDAIARTRDAATAAQPAAEALLPAGWHTNVGQPSHGGCYTLDLHPPAGPVDLYAYLVPPIAGNG